MKFATTKKQIARGAKPDAEHNNTLYLIKKVSILNITYQIELLLYRAVQSGMKLVLDVPKSCELSSSLQELVKEHRRNLEIVRS